MMAITESDLRDILAADSGDGPGRGVAVADVDRRARRIRRRRLAAVTGVLTAGLAVAGVLAVPRTVTAEVPDDIWTAVMAQPSPSPRPSPSGAYTHIAVGKIAERKFHRAGVKQRLTYRTGKGFPSLQIRCPDAPSYVVVWVNRLWVEGQPCGSVKGKRTDGQVSGATRLWWEESGLNTVEVLVVPAGDVPDDLASRRKDPGVNDLGVKDENAVVAAARPYQAEWGVTMWEMDPID
ncbi:hypothetical protein ACQP25_12725 [Microtetraspora malaysiensis]|uniref:hypothetical protein n=1 Tax=Microtetraspora malaysiensis TaxID=161358 RepID=UPI003D905695